MNCDGPKQPTRVEIAVQDQRGAEIALAAGADRIELCAALAATGGLTPTPATVRACAQTGIHTHVLIRPRPGGYIYTGAEIELMCEEIRDAKAAGAAGVVIGAATAKAELDVRALTQMIEAADGIDVILHRVFDILADPLTALDQVCDLGVRRILTSAGALTAPAGRENLARLCQLGKKIEIMAGGGIRPSNVEQLAGIGLSAIHASCSGPGPDTGKAGPGGGSDTVSVTDPNAVKALVAAVANWR